MTNRELAFIVKDQKPLALPGTAPVRAACRTMWERRTGSVLVLDAKGRLAGIFTGRDAVRHLGRGREPDVPLAKAMTRRPVTVTPDSSAMDALRAMSEGGFRHVPVVEDDRIWGVVSRGDLKGMELEKFLRRRVAMTAGSPTNRELAHVIEDQKPLVLPATETVGTACKAMARRKSGSTLVVDARGRLRGIFTGRDAVHVLAKARAPSQTPLSKAMTRGPVMITADCRAIDALRAMSEGGFRHLPVVEDSRVLGVVSRSDFTGLEVDRFDEEQYLWESIR